MNAIARGIKWGCSTHRSRGCKAFLLLDDNEVVIEDSLNHTHTELKYVLTSKGEYIRVK